MRIPKFDSFPLTFALILLASLIPLGMLAVFGWVRPPVAPQAEADRLALELDRLLQLRLTETFTIASLPSIRVFAASDPNARTARLTVASNELQAWVAADKPLREAFIVDTNGVSILSTESDWGQSWSTRAFVKQALAGKLDVSAPSRDSGEMSQYYAAPILDANGQVAGALVARIEAQEFWEPVSAASSGQAFAVLVDENGVRLADGGDASRNLTALAPLTTDEQLRLLTEQTYGAQLTVLRMGQLSHAAELIRSGAVESLRASDFGASAMSSQVLTTKPWVVLVFSASTWPGDIVSGLVEPFIAALLAAALVSFLIRRKNGPVARPSP